ncbi:uncharacterized protein LOC105427066 isoform X3 [Pogonomyrmex barbatus]|uniref:Uncharacterized protein LOC105427066 isoform X3 n=1 Tax=Pogonomyrmex barbatus TaxID=144034 RepID=A0A6I9W4R7_9HYME|nr:uncharacterized protein LOC105427066 isoform X3 [Pogonomyrmex barbatus]
MMKHDSNKTKESMTKDIVTIIKTTQNDGSNLRKELENEDISKVHKDENIENEIRTEQDEEDNSKKELKNKDICKIKHKDGDIENGMNRKNEEQNEDSNSTEESMNEDTCEVKFDSEDEGVEEENYSEVTYLARQMASTERLCQAEAVQLYNLHVKLRHTVPPQHKIETRAGSHIPTRKEIEKFRKIIPIRKGTYSFEEDKIIASNWKTFCKLHNWDKRKTKPFLQLRIGTLTYMRNTTERRKFVQFLADGLPDRTLYSVYHRFRNLYENNLQRRYIPEEDKMIIDHLENNPFLDERRKYVDLAKVLRRTRNSIWRRYQILKKRKRQSA